MIYIYANHPVIRRDGRYYAKTANFVDFLGELAAVSMDYKLILPCREGGQEDVSELVALDLPDDIIEVSPYQGHLAAIFTTFINALILRRIITRLSGSESYSIGGPGPNSMLFWLSYLLPKSDRFYFFIRGDTVETVRHIYKRKKWGWLPVLMSSLFEQRIFFLLASNRATVFTYGDRLRDKYLHHGSNVYSIAPLVSENITEMTPAIRSDSLKLLKVLFVGRLSAEKGIFELVESVVRLRGKGFGIELVILGDGYLKSEICSYLESYDPERCVHVVGHVVAGPNLWRYFDDADLLCLPSKTEGTPRVIVEAFARELPVLATQVGSIPYMFPGNIALMKHGNADEIENLLEWCMDNRSKLRGMAKAGRRDVYKYMLSYNAERVDAVIHKAIDGGTL